MCVCVCVGGGGGGGRGGGGEGGGEPGKQNASIQSCTRYSISPYSMILPSIIKLFQTVSEF